MVTARLMYNFCPSQFDIVGGGGGGGGGSCVTLP